MGTSKGQLIVYDITSDVEKSRFSIEVKVAAHLPHSGPQDQKFGQLGKQ